MADGLNHDLDIRYYTSPSVDICLKIPSGLSEAVNRRTENTMTKR